MAIILVSEKIVEKHYLEIKMTLEKGATLRTVYKMLRFALPYLEFKRIVEKKYPSMLEAVERKNLAGRMACRESIPPKEVSRLFQVQPDALPER